MKNKIERIASGFWISVLSAWKNPNERWKLLYAFTIICSILIIGYPGSLIIISFVIIYIIFYKIFTGKKKEEKGD